MNTLMEAIRRSDTAALQDMLDTGMDPNALDDARHAVLCEAASRNQLDAVSLLLHHRADVNIRQPDGRRPLTEAAFKGHLEMVQLLLAHGAVINAGGQGDGSALFWAACADVLDVVRHLLQAGCDVNQPAADGYTPLHQAASSGRPRAFDIAQALLQYGADVNHTSAHGITALMRSMPGGHLEIARLLLASGADPMATTDRQETAMILACRAYHEHPEMIPLLMQYGAEPRVKDQYGASALRVAASEGNSAAVGALIESRLDVNGDPDESMTPLQASARAGRTDVVRVLIANGADLDRQGSGGLDTPLLESLLYHRDEIAQRLIEAGADVNQRGYQGATPLLYALGCLDDLTYERSVPPKVNLPLIRLLLEKGADPSVRPAFDQTALDLARKTRNTRLIGLIKRAASPR